MVHGVKNGSRHADDQVVRPALAILLICATTACGGSPTDRAQAPTKSPPATAPDLRKGLLTAAQLRTASGAPFVRVPSSTATQNHSPGRSPCGAKASLPPRREGALALFRSGAPPGELAEWIIDLPVGRAAALVAIARGDMRPGCPAFRSATPFRPFELDRFVRPVALPALADDRLAALVRIQVGARTRPFYLTEVMLRDGDRLTLINLATHEPPPARVVRLIAARAATDVERVPPAASAA